MILGAKGTRGAGHRKRLGTTLKLGLIEERGELGEHGGMERPSHQKPPPGANIDNKPKISEYPHVQGLPEVRNRLSWTRMSAAIPLAYSNSLSR